MVMVDYVPTCCGYFVVPIKIICILRNVMYCIALDYYRSCINAWSRLVAGGTSIIITINTSSQMNSGSFVDP